jgi:hypothetical protein
VSKKSVKAYTRHGKGRAQQYDALIFREAIDKMGGSEKSILIVFRVLWLMAGELQPEKKPVPIYTVGLGWLECRSDKECNSSSDTAHLCDPPNIQDIDALLPLAGFTAFSSF